MNNFRNSPLWLIGFFILFAEATAGIAAVKISGWPQAALVIFVISYATVVTATFFAFLWFKPENFYGPNEYGKETTPEMFIQALKGQGLPDDTIQAVAESEKYGDKQFYKLLDNVIPNNEKQILILLKRQSKKIPISSIISYRFATRDNGLSIGSMGGQDLMKKLNGTELLSDNNSYIELSDKGNSFADWLINENKDAKSFDSVLGSWGNIEDIDEIIDSLRTDRDKNHITKRSN
ncbi:hypothetical protein [Celerinatantimonas diazotrophica]|uniref:Uncharacterized protein n=1 Tax=Celerinatantimonas diazotrophica TaxID=412034 RepID=A0A4R1K502_9GAMM|nr:hypothetical protein [Celerinatantimonas diazotrophica]TCK58823.1 hypothetical protein EV690_0972 [Celerinatantimonas diazotrophica]CAG9297455.1 hypothetical protein CEDIAZO_02636 [Celerinatantimonas diazotrophica]